MRGAELAFVARHISPEKVLRRLQAETRTASSIVTRCCTCIALLTDFGVAGASNKGTLGTQSSDIGCSFKALTHYLTGQTQVRMVIQQCLQDL